MESHIEKLRSSAEISAEMFVLRNKVNLLEHDLRFRNELSAVNNTKDQHNWTSPDKLQRILFAFDPVRVQKLNYPNTQTFMDVCIHREDALDLYRVPFVLLLLCEGAKIPSLRVAFDSSRVGDWSEVTEHHLNLFNGCNLFYLTGQELEAAPGKAKLAEVRHISIGGAGADASVRVWAICGSENLIALRALIAPELEADQRIAFIDGYPYRVAVAYRRLPMGLRIVVGKILRPLANLVAMLIRCFR